jgi:L-asparagine transporter-like permease
MTEAEVRALPFRMWLFPWLSYAAQGGILAVLIAMAFFKDLASQLYLTLAFAGVLWLIYFALSRRRTYILPPKAL